MRGGSKKAHKFGDWKIPEGAKVTDFKIFHKEVDDSDYDDFFWAN